LLCKKNIVAKSKEVKIGCNLADFSKEGYGSKKAVLPMMMMMMTNSMELSHSSEAVNRSATQEFPNILRDQMVHYRVHKSPRLAHFMSQINPVHTTQSYLSKIHSNIIIPSTPTSS
jgi:hypothetical protein